MRGWMEGILVKNLEIEDNIQVFLKESDSISTLFVNTDSSLCVVVFQDK